MTDTPNVQKYTKMVDHPEQADDEVFLGYFQEGLFDGISFPSKRLGERTITIHHEETPDELFTPGFAKVSDIIDYYLSELAKADPNRSAELRCWISGLGLSPFAIEMGHGPQECPDG